MKVTVETSKEVLLARSGRRRLRDRTRYRILEDGRTVIQVYSRSEVARLARKRYGSDVDLRFEVAS